MRKFGGNPKRAGTVSERLGLNAPRALNVSSPLERSEKVGSQSREIFLLIVSQETYFWEILQGNGGSSAFAVGIAATAALGAAVAVCFPGRSVCCE